MTSWATWAGTELSAIRAAGRWRVVRDLDGRGQVHSLAGVEGAVVSFASNDYLGLTTHPTVVSAAHEALDRWGAGSGSARLIVGSRPVHTALETELAGWKETEAALLFPTGFAANLGVLSALGTADVTIVSDELNHASIIDGCRLARSEVAIARHGDLDHFAALVAGARARGRRPLVVTETVFSMDGDRAPLAGLASLCADHDALLVLDEAHSVLGPAPAQSAGGGLLRVGTLSKTLGALGGFAAGPRALIDLLRNRARPFIFTTASTPADTAAALAALHVLRGPEGAALVTRLRGLVARLRPGHGSPIIPVVLGGEADALAAADALLGRGMLVPAIRPPTVPVGTSRLRIALSAAHTDHQLDQLSLALGELGLHDRGAVGVAT
ncbi:MAG TPA: 8-amino-7-oxononanoate synthase [Acidimicrobiales bacterium]